MRKKETTYVLLKIIILENKWKIVIKRVNHY